jgi:hypothetical protein
MRSWRSPTVVLPAIVLPGIVFLGIVTVLGSLVAVVADEPSKPQAASREKVARRFAAEHHPELARLLGELAKQDRKQYDAAITDIHRAIDRMEKYREKQPERYETTLEDWKLSSRIRLAVARMSLTKDPELEAQLRELVEARQQLRLKPLRTEAERIESRLEKIRTTIAEHDANPEAAIAAPLGPQCGGSRPWPVRQTRRGKARTRKARERDPRSTGTGSVTGFVPPRTTLNLRFR